MAKYNSEIMYKNPEDKENRIAYNTKTVSDVPIIAQV